MKGACVLTRADCWPVDPPAASVIALMTVVFVACVACVIGAGLPGKASALLSSRERSTPGRVIGAAMLYAGWMAVNLAIAGWLWTQLFPRNAPVRVVHDARTGDGTVACPPGALIQVRCLLTRLQVPEADRLNPERLARATLDALDAGEELVERGDGELVTPDLAVYAALLAAPVSDVVLVGIEGVDPASIEELATHGWPWLSRWLTTREHRGLHVQQVLKQLSPEDSVAACGRAPRAASIPASAVVVRFCMVRSEAREIEAILRVSRAGKDLLVDLRGRNLPGQAHASIDGTPLVGAVDKERFGGNRGVLRLVDGAAKAKHGRVLRVGIAPDRLTLMASLGLSDAYQWCLVVDGRDPTQVEAQRSKVLAGPDVAWRREALGALRVSGDLCANGSLFVAANGVVIAGLDLQRQQARMLAAALAPNRREQSFRPRVLTPPFDTAPGLLDDVRLGQMALRTDTIVASPLVVREVAFTGPPVWPVDTGRGFADFVADRLVDTPIPLAPIVAWIEPATAAAGVSRVLAASFGQELWAPDPGLAVAAWGTLAAMQEAFEEAAEGAFHPGPSIGDAVGVALNRAVDEDRQHSIFAALACWLLLMFGLRWGVRGWARS